MGFKAFIKRICISMIIILMGSTIVGLTKRDTRDHRSDRQKVPERHRSAIKGISPFMEWMIGANKKGFIDAVISPGVRNTSFYNIKNLEKRKFLQYENETTTAILSKTNWRPNWVV